MKTVNCPNCGKKVIWKIQSQWRPFCCERCKLIDLGDWASESNRIKGESVMPENLLDSDVTE